MDIEELPKCHGDRIAGGDVMFRIESLKEEDRGAVRTLELFCLRETLESSLMKKWSELSQELIDQLGASSKISFEHYLRQGLSYVAKEDSMIVGFIFAQIIPHILSLPSVIWVENLGVHPEFRRKGIAYKLLKTVASEGKKLGAKAIYSTIMPDNIRSIMLHKKLGFFVDSRKIALLDLDRFE